MELRAYWSVVWRWRWLVVAVALAVFVATLAVQPREPTLYNAVFQVAVEPNLAQLTAANPAREQYYEFITAELLVDDAAYTIETKKFHEMATERAKAALGRPVAGTVATKKVHKVLGVTVTGDDREGAQALAKAILDAVLDPTGKLFSGIVNFQPKLAVTADIYVVEASGPSRALLYLALRVLLGVFAGLGLAFLLEYLDDSLRTAKEVERVTGLPVLAEIPAGRARLAKPPSQPDGKTQTA